jgi:SAM-dependent methyltransferase
MNYIHEANSGESVDQHANKLRFIKLFAYLDRNPQTSSTPEFLDFGCGSDAETLLFSSSIGYVSQGVELTQSSREQATHQSGCEIFSPSELFSSNRKYDVIFLGDILEHVYEPTLILSNLQRHLKLNGRLFIQGPLEGARTISNFLLGIKALCTSKRSSNLPPYHVSLANLKAVKLLLENAGYNIVQYEVTEPLWPAKSILSIGSYQSLSNLVFSFSKLLDMALSRIFKNFGTRIYLVARSK